MIGEGSERSKERPEGHDEDESPEVDEKPQTARDVWEELRPEIENRPPEPEESEPPSQDPIWYPETAEPSVRDATKELAWKEDLEREREEEQESEREKARQEREEEAERDALEKELEKALEDCGIDSEDFKEKGRDQFVKDIEDYLKDQPEEQEKDSNEEDGEGTSGQKPGVESSSQYDAGSGQMYELKTKPSVESDTEAETEPQSEQAADTQEPESSPESEPPKESAQLPSEKSEPRSEPEAVPSEHKRRGSKEDVDEPEIECVPTEKPSSKTRSVEDMAVQEKKSPRTEQTTLDIPQETTKSEKEGESDEAKEEAETETSELYIKVNEPKEEAETETSVIEAEIGETKEETEAELQEPESVDELEDLSWQEQIMRIYNETPDEWKEMFREYLRGIVEDDEDLRRLLEKHGLGHLIEDEEQMDEVRKFLELKVALREQGEEQLESIAEELGIDMEQAEQWASGEVEPQILKDVLNLEAYWAFWEILRLNAEHGFPESAEELESILQDNPMLELEDPTLPFELWKRDAKAWVEIMEMKRRGEIGIRLRNGREIYSREDIERLSGKYGTQKAEIIAWLRGEKAPPLIRRIGKRKLKKQIIGDTSETIEMNPILYSPEGSAYSVEDIRRLYYDERLSKSEIARSLGIANSTVHRVFEKNKWKSLPAPKKGEPEQAYKLSQLGLTHKEIAERMGLSRSTVSNYLRELGVSRNLLTDSERKQKRKEKSRKVVENAKTLRDKLFGTKCSICGATREKRTIAIHNKDFKEHKLNALWRPSFLQKVNPEDWAALCIMCHRGVHWGHDDLGMNWQDIENLIRNLDSGDGTQTISFSKPRLTDLPPSPKEEIEKLRKKLFGEECYFCGPIPDGKNRVIHNKDGKPHPRQALWRRKFLQQMNPDEWVLVCQKHHRYVHWAMKRLGMSWEDIESTFRRSRRE